MRTFFVLIVFVTCMSPSAFAGEKFFDVWELKTPDNDSEKKVELRSAITFPEKNEVKLFNRGTLLSHKDFANGAEIEFQWKLSDGGDKPEPDGRIGKYQDILTIALFTTGKQPSWSYEVEDGILVRLNPNSSTVVVELRHKDQKPKELLVLNDMVFKKGTVYTVRIRADAKKEWLDLSVLPKAMRVNQGCSIPISGLKGRKVAVYNRESVADVVKSSFLKDITLKGKEEQVVQN